MVDVILKHTTSFYIRKASHSLSSNDNSIILFNTNISVALILKQDFQNPFSHLKLENRAACLLLIAGLFTKLKKRVVLFCPLLSAEGPFGTKPSISFVANKMCSKKHKATKTFFRH